MLVKARNVYTIMIFEEFQHDYEEYQGAYIKTYKQGEFAHEHEYTIANFDKSKERIVMANILEQIVSCSCRKFDTWYLA